MKSKKGFSAASLKRRQARFVQPYQAFYYVPTYRRVYVPAYVEPSYSPVETPAIQPLVVQEEPMPEIDESTCKDGSCALKQTQRELRHPLTFGGNDDSVCFTRCMCVVFRCLLCAAVG